MVTLVACGRIGFDATTSATDGQPPTSGRPCGYTAVDTGRSHTCALRTDGVVECWGSNDNYILDDTLPYVTAPTVVTLPRPATAIALGSYSSCALLDDASVTCWGANQTGQLGDSSGVSHDTPVQALPPGSAVEIVAGAFHVCARHADGTVSCWGDDQDGQCGNPQMLDRTPPTVVAGLSNVVRLAAGHRHTCARLANGTASCWGKNYEAELGDGATSNPRSTPNSVANLTNVVELKAGGRHSCALLANGTVTCWGRNNEGQYGVGDTAGGTAPTRPSLVTNASHIIVASHHTCALRTDGSVQCWGTGMHGDLGNATLASEQPTPVTVALSRPAVAISGHFKHACAILDDGSVECWGSNSLGQHGNGMRSVVDHPVDVATNVTAVTAGDDHTCAIAGGQLRCWGANISGALGTGNLLGADTPTPITLANPVEISAGTDFTCATVMGGQLYCWGANWAEQLGAVGGDQHVPTPSPITTMGTSLASGRLHTCVRDGTQVRCFGFNDNGQLGNGSVTGTTSAPAIANVTSVDAGYKTSCAISSTNGLMCWGANDRGQIGDGTLTRRTAPTATAAAVVSPKFVAAGEHTCAIDNANALWCWGDNGGGQVGKGDYTDSEPSPVRITAMPDAKAVAIGVFHTCAIALDGEVYCWGSNEKGQLGMPSTTVFNSATPVHVVGAGPAQSITAGVAYTCVVTTSGTLRCWGDNDTGEVGIPITHSTPSPVSCAK